MKKQAYLKSTILGIPHNLILVLNGMNAREESWIISVIEKEEVFRI